METLRAERVLSTFHGSSWPVLAQAGGQKVVVKLRGTAQGLLPLVAEIVVGALADALGLATPERCLVEVSPEVVSDDPHEELRDLLERSHGLNLGLRYLDGFRDVTVGDASRVDPQLAASIVWLDALVQNPDRTPKNPNLMIKAGKIELIDHGAALDFHHDWRRVTEQAPREAGNFVAEHLLQVTEQQLAAADSALAPKISRPTLERALSEVPDDFLAEPGSDAPERQRAAYVAYLHKRLHAPRPFVARGKHVPFQFGR
ncbi:MAG TPA: HipA family kinase [Polyangiaceae bacterium]|nr:HipA family kinase [Polyangiaceae bacterium]